MWELFSTAFGPTKTLADSLDADRREQVRRAWVELLESYREGDHVRHPREYVLTHGVRR